MPTKKRKKTTTRKSVKKTAAKKTTSVKGLVPIKPIGKPTVRCGRTSFKGSVCGSGTASTYRAALVAAVWDARLKAHCTGMNWIAAQICPASCPVKDWYVHLLKPRIVARNEYVIPRYPEVQQPKMKVIRVCVDLQFTAAVICTRM